MARSEARRSSSARRACLGRLAEHRRAAEHGRSDRIELVAGARVSARPPGARRRRSPRRWRPARTDVGQPDPPCNRNPAYARRPQEPDPPCPARPTSIGAAARGREDRREHRQLRRNDAPDVIPVEAERRREPGSCGAAHIPRRARETATARRATMSGGAFGPAIRRRSSRRRRIRLRARWRRPRPAAGPSRATRRTSRRPARSRTPTRSPPVTRIGVNATSRPTSTPSRVTSKKFAASGSSARCQAGDRRERAGAPG